MAWSAKAREAALAARRAKAKNFKTYGLRANDVFPENPGGGWLRWERHLARDLNMRGSTTFAVRGIKMPTRLIAKLPGELSEHKRIGKKDKRVSELAKAIKSKGRILHDIHVGVDYQGKATIFEGNHRVRAALVNRMKRVPVSVTYFAGGERVRGAMSLKTLKTYSKRSA